MTIQKKNVKQTSTEKLTKTARTQDQLVASALTKMANGGSSVAHISTFNKVMAGLAGRQVVSMSEVERLFKGLAGVGAVAISADRIINRATTVSPGDNDKFCTTNLEQLVDITGASVNLAGGAVNVAEALKGEYLYNMCPWAAPAITAIYGVAGGVGLADFARSNFQETDFME